MADDFGGKEKLEHIENKQTHNSFYGKWIFFTLDFGDMRAWSYASMKIKRTSLNERK